MEPAKVVASSLSNLPASKAAAILAGLLQEHGPSYVTDVLMVLQDYDRKRHGQDDEWWLEMMHEAGEEVSKLF